MLRVAWWLVVAWAAVYPVGFMWGVLGLPYPGELGVETIFYGVTFVVAGLYVHARTGDSWRELVPLRPVDPWLAIPVALFAWAGLVFNAALTSLCRALAVLPPEVSDLAAGGATDATPVDPSLFHALVANSLLPALCEEALMRGLVLHALMATMSKRRAIVVSALCFAVIHFRIERMPDLVISGIVYGWMAARTGSLLPSMLAHALHNGVVVLIDQGMVGSIEVDANGLLPVTLVWMAVAIAVLGLAWLALATPARRLVIECRSTSQYAPLTGRRSTWKRPE